MSDTPVVFYLVRHGEVQNPLHITYGRIRNVPLSALGESHLETLGRDIQSVGDTPSIAVTSPLLRTRQSTDHFLKLYTSCSVISDDRLLETDSRNFVGRYLEWIHDLGNSYDELVQKKYDYWVEPPVHQADRVVDCITQTLASNPFGCALFVSHGHPITFAAYRLLYPNHDIPPIQELKKTMYVNRGEAWRFVWNMQREVIDAEKIHLDGTRERFV
jgi:broad specificity phosphatase PhoE